MIYLLAAVDGAVFLEGGLAAQEIESAEPFAGSLVCKTCHPDVWLMFPRNAHFRGLAAGDQPPGKTGCESCHGPGGEHVRGDSAKYQSDVNLGNGLRLLSGHLGIYLQEGRGRWIDELVLTTQGLGNDLYQFAALRVRKNRLFEYNMNWRWNSYFNPATTIASGRRLFDTNRRWRVHDLLLRPRSRVRGVLGYSRNLQDGPALSMVNLFGSPGDEFSTLQSIRRERNEYRLGGEVETRRVRLRVVR